MKICRRYDRLSCATMKINEKIMIVAIGSDRIGGGSVEVLGTSNPDRGWILVCFIIQTK